MNSGRRTSGFSLIELLVVIGLIAVLSSLLLIGVGHLITNSKRQQTRLAFQNLQSMYSEWDAVNRRHFFTANIPCPTNVTAQGADHYGDAVLMTRDMMAQLRTMPANAAAMGKMSPAAFMSVPAATAAQPYWNAWAAGAPYYTLNRVSVQNNDPNTSFITPYYYFVCIQNTSSALPTDTTCWLPSTVDPTVPILIDGWGNPIIFVPGAILGSDPFAASPPPNASYMTAGGQKAQMRSPDGRPFWASAGPDGDFSLGDDNLYSFEK